MFQSLKVKIALWVGVPLILIVSVSHLVALRGIQKELMTAAELRARSLHGVINRSIFYIMLHGRSHKGGIDTLLKAIYSISEVEQIRIFSEEGIILKSSKPEEIREKIYKEVEEATRKINITPEKIEGEEVIVFPKGKDSFSLTWPILNYPNCRRCHKSTGNVHAFVNMDISVKPLRDLLITSRNLIIGSEIISYLLIIGIAFLIHTRFVDRPLKEMITKMEQVEKGDLTAKIQIDSTDEFARVGRSFNSMIQKLDIAQEMVEKHHREQMVHADRLASLGELASGIAHEIRNPLVGIARAAETLSRQFQPDDQRYEVTTLITKELERLDRNIKTILMYARPKPVHFSFCNLNEIMEHTLFLANLNPYISHIIIEKDYAPNLPKVKADKELIEQVFLNIILNAIQAMEGKGTLWLKIEEVEKDGNPSVRIKIKDTGKGMSEETMQGIFKPFFTTKSQGTGLGLSIVRNTIEQHHGSISVESKLHQGTTFTISLPQNQDTQSE